MGGIGLKTLKAWLPALLWMMVIFLMSATPGDLSGAQSGMIVRMILAVHGLLFGDTQLSPDMLTLLHTLVRKAAHMAEYAVLACLYLRPLRMHGIKHPHLLSIALCALYAASDELHQAFVPGRGPSPIDVMIDTAGACIGLFLVRALIRMKTRKATT